MRSGLVSVFEMHQAVLKAELKQIAPSRGADLYV